MSSLKRLYFSVTSGLGFLQRHKVKPDSLQDFTVSDRVSRDVIRYKTQFFNL